jgi:hypothetical protein
MTTQNPNAIDTSTLVADESIYGWSVEDTNGGRWWPSDEAQALIEAAADPAAEAVRMCEEQPTLGLWLA